MEDLWFVNVNSLKKQLNNSYPFAHYLFAENKQEVAKICQSIDLKKLQKSCQIEIKNCQDRFVWNWLALIGFCAFFILGIILIIINALADHHTHGMIIAGIIICVIDVIVAIVVYFADNWSNPFMYWWYQILLQLKPYLLNTQDLPVSLYLLYFPNQYKVRKYPNSFYFLYALSTKQFNPHLTKYLNSQLLASMVGDSYDPNKQIINLQNYLKYWGNIVAIYEWANFLLSLINWYQINQAVNQVQIYHK